MSDNRSFTSASLPAHHNPAFQTPPHTYHQSRDDHAQLVTGYTQELDTAAHKRSTPSSPLDERSVLSTERPSAPTHGATVPVQLPSLHGTLHDPTRALYGPGMGTGSALPGSYPGLAQSDENSIDTFRLPLTASTPSPHSPHDYQNQPSQLHQDSHGGYSQASYYDQHSRRYYHSSGATANVASSSSSSPTYSHPRQHHPHTQMLPSMLYPAAHSDDPSPAPAFTRPFASAPPHPYTQSSSNSSLSPQLGTSHKASVAPATSADDRQLSPAPQPTARSLAKRREKPKIELSSDQPLTTQGKPRARVYIACVQW